MHRVRLYFDFISPYSYLALTRAESFAREHGVRWEVRPVLYAALLEARGLIGPAEEPAKREYTARDVVRCADRMGVTLAGLPAHPFNSLAALRTACLFQEDARAIEIVARIGKRGWGLGLDLTDLTVLAGALEEIGIDAHDLPERIQAPGVKDLLRANTEAALGDGVFGVPSFVWEGELFWGHDRMDHLADRIAGRLASPEGRAVEIAARPRGADRKKRPRSVSRD